MSGKNRLTSETRARIERFVEISKAKGISVELNPEETKVMLKNRKGEVIASRPVTDFTDG